VRVVPPFTGVELTGANNVVVHVGGKLLRRVTTTVRSGTLVMDTTPGNLGAKRPMFVTVSAPVASLSPGATAGPWRSRCPPSAAREPRCCAARSGHP
jgi:hypothetical protein